MTKPILEKLAQEYAEKVNFLSINADNSPHVLQQFQVIGIPTVMALRDEKVLGRVTGAQSEASYRAMFDALADGNEVKVPLSAFNRMLRFSAGVLFIMIGISTSNWFLASIGGFVAFLGVYDRCPVWNAIIGMSHRN